eukprot:c17760_g1_i2.p1 GENE.c17760_g1_i2~~c17760_g1_i2.p1  ORF type:complete len:213 (-),score=38.21 c17760_g1_i2:149-787(-)
MNRTQRTVVWPSQVPKNEKKLENNEIPIVQDNAISSDESDLYEIQPRPLQSLTVPIHHKKAADGGIYCRVDNCGAHFPDTFQLLAHHQSHHKKLFCDWPGCEKYFFLKRSQHLHLKTHQENVCFKCVVTGCTKTYKTTGNLKAHLRIHTGERPFKCHFRDCEKAFCDSSSLTKHTRTHTGERPFACPICQKGFIQPGHRSRHLLSHQNKVDQ